MTCIEIDANFTGPGGELDRGINGLVDSQGRRIYTEPQRSNPLPLATAVYGDLANSSRAVVLTSGGDSGSANSATTPQLAAKSGNPFRISVWRQRQRVRVYINQEKVWDVPRGLAASAKPNTILFALFDADAANTYFLTNFRVATDAPDTQHDPDRRAVDQLRHSLRCEQRSH